MLLLEDNFCLVVLCFCPLLPDPSVRRVTTLVLPQSAPVKGAYIAQLGLKRFWCPVYTVCVLVRMSDEVQKFISTAGGKPQSSMGLFVNNWKLPSKFKYKTYKELIERLKRAFGENGCSAGIAVISSINALGAFLYFSQVKVPKAHWDEVVNAIRDLYFFTNKDDDDGFEENFREHQRMLHDDEEDESAGGNSKSADEGGEGGSTKDATPSTRSKTKGAAAEVEGKRKSGETKSTSARAKVTPSMIDAFVNGAGNLSTVMARLEEFTPDARASLEPILSHLLVSNAFIEAILRKCVVDDGSVVSALENAKAMSKDEKAKLAPKLFGIFGVDPTVYIALQEIRRQAETNKLEEEPQLQAEKEYAMVTPGRKESFMVYFSRFCELRRNVGTARNMSTNDALPEKSAVAKIVQSMEESGDPIFADLGRKMRSHIRERELLKFPFPSLEDVKILCDSHYKSTPASDGGGGVSPGAAGGSGAHQRSVKKGPKQGRKAQDSLDDPHAVAHMARGRSGKLVCYRCQKEGHMSHECMEPYPAARKKSVSRSPTSKKRDFRKKGGGEGTGSTSSQHSANGAILDKEQVELRERNAAATNEQAAATMKQAAAEEALNRARAAGRAAGGDPHPGVFA